MLLKSLKSYKTQVFINFIVDSRDNMTGFAQLCAFSKILNYDCRVDNPVKLAEIIKHTWI